MEKSGNLIGVILAGGFSTRMGTDKGLLKTGSGETWVVRQKNTLSVFTDMIVVSIRMEQFPDYLHFFPENSIIPDNSQFSGPAAGILSVFAKFPTKDIILLPCDMPGITVDIMEIPYLQYIADSSYDFYGFKTTFGIEPLAGIYTVKGLTKLQVLYDKYKGLYKFIETAESFLIAKDTQGHFLNFNTKESLKDLIE